MTDEPACPLLKFMASVDLEPGQAVEDITIHQRRAAGEEGGSDQPVQARRVAELTADADDSADVELAASHDGTSRVIVVDTGGSADAADSSKPGLVSRGGISTWDYASEII